MRVICVLLPHFPLMCETFRHPGLEHCPVVITKREGSQNLVLDYSPGLEELQQNTPVQHALARYGNASLVQADIPYYWSSFNRILDEMENISPLVEGSELGVIYLGVDGLQLIYPDDTSLTGAVREALPG